MPFLKMRKHNYYTIRNFLEISRLNCEKHLFLFTINRDYIMIDLCKNQLSLIRKYLNKYQDIKMLRKHFIITNDNKKIFCNTYCYNNDYEYNLKDTDHILNNKKLLLIALMDTIPTPDRSIICQIQKLIKNWPNMLKK